LERVARGELPHLPGSPEVRAALDERARVLESNRLGSRTNDGRFHFRDGALDELKQAELSREAREAAKERPGLFRDVTPGAGHEHDWSESTRIGGEEPWRVRDTKELFAGKTAILERGRDLALAPMQPGMGIGPGDSVSLNVADQMSKAPQLEMTKLLGRGLGLEL
jgi:hypothetical protein